MTCKASHLAAARLRAARGLLFRCHHSAKKARQNHHLAGFRYLDDISTTEKAPAKLWQAAKKLKLCNEIKGNGGEDVRLSS